MTNCSAIEFEVFREKGNLKNIIINGSGAAGAGGRLRVWGFMTNGIFHASQQIGCLHPFFGIGFGLAHFNIRTSGTGNVFDISDTQTAFAIQTISGLTYPMSDCTDVCLEYRYLFTGDPRFMTGAGAGIKAEFSSYSLNLALRYFF
jgi:opacity protein-like surface antigen